MTYVPFRPEPIEPGLPSREGKRWYCVSTMTRAAGAVCLHVLARSPYEASTFAGHTGSDITPGHCRLTNILLPVR